MHSWEIQLRTLHHYHTRDNLHSGKYLAMPAAPQPKVKRHRRHRRSHGRSRRLWTPPLGANAEQSRKRSACICNLSRLAARISKWQWPLGGGGGGSGSGAVFDPLLGCLTARWRGPLPPSASESDECHGIHAKCACMAQHDSRDFAPRRTSSRCGRKPFQMGPVSY